VPGSRRARREDYDPYRKIQTIATSRSLPSSSHQFHAAQRAQSPVQSPVNALCLAPSRDEVVWVNTASGFYHKPNSRHYGKTKRGKYMQESDAVHAGYRPAPN
jgi:hypothetical protein